MLRIYLYGTVLLTVKYVDMTKTSPNVTAWLASSRDPPMIILQTNQMIPSVTDCKQNGKTFKEGASWFEGHLLYKCMKFGAYTILGCRTRKDRQMNIGETYIDDFIAHQCFEDNSKIYYRESPCDIPGQPSCGSFEQGPTTNSSQTALAAVFDRISQTGGYPSIAGLPEGWKIVDSYGIPVPLDQIKVITSYPANSVPTVTVSSGCIMDRSFLNKILRFREEPTGKRTWVPRRSTVILDNDNVTRMYVDVDTDPIKIYKEKVAVELNVQKKDVRIMPGKE